MKVGVMGGIVVNLGFFAIIFVVTVVISMTMMKVLANSAHLVISL